MKRAMISLARTALMAAALLAFPLTASAQRQAAGRSALELSFRPGPSQKGVGANIVRWGYDAAHIFGISLMTSDRPFTYYAFETSGGTTVKKTWTSLDFDMSCTDILGSVGGLYRLLSTRTRSVVICAGGTVDAGVRVYGLFTPAPSYPTRSSDWEIPESMNMTAEDLTAGGVNFVCGLSPVLQLEMFPFRSASVCLRGIPRIQLMNAYEEGWFFPCVTLGVNLYL